MALTGFLVNIGGGSAVCADGFENAIQALGSRFPYVGGSQPVLCHLESSTHTPPDIFTNTITCHTLTGNQMYTYAHDLRLMACDPTAQSAQSVVMFADGLEMGWGVVGAMFAALAVIFVAKALR